MSGFIPRVRILTEPGLLYTAIGILGATVMPHNLFLHSAIVQTRNYPRTPAGAVHFSLVRRHVASKYGALCCHPRPDWSNQIFAADVRRASSFDYAL